MAARRGFFGMVTQCMQHDGGFSPKKSFPRDHSDFFGMVSRERLCVRECDRPSSSCVPFICIEKKELRRGRGGIMRGGKLGLFACARSAVNKTEVRFAIFVRFARLGNILWLYGLCEANRGETTVGRARVKRQRDPHHA